MDSWLEQRPYFDIRLGHFEFGAIEEKPLIKLRAVPK